MVILPNVEAQERIRGTGLYVMCRRREIGGLFCMFACTFACMFAWLLLEVWGIGVWNVECGMCFRSLCLCFSSMCHELFVVYRAGWMNGWMDELNDWAMICGFEDRMRWHGIGLDSI